MTPTPTIPVPTARRPWIRPDWDDNPPPTVHMPSRWNLSHTPPPIEKLTASSLSLEDTTPDQTVAMMPHTGETFLGFRLVEELGRGAFAKVFLAEQVDLAGRLVALKVTRRATHEAERLARLHHTNIVPVYSVHDAHPVQAICMPFLGRRTIVDGLKLYHRGNYSSRRGLSVRSSRSTATSVSKWPSSGASSGEIRLPGTFPVMSQHAVPADHSLIGNVEAVLRLLSALAAGLSHAHGRNILHLDIKPANVLLSDSGEPMLLDFNLSYDTTASVRDIVGGTPQYMAPEQLADVKSHGHGHVDARTDLYSLGVLAHELLTGDVPFPAPSSRKPGEYDRLAAARSQALPLIREKNPDVTPAVDAIVRKLLEVDPAQRYQSADDLREDLERQLGNRPLKFAAEPSLRERCVKWRRRNPKLPVRLALFGLLAFGIAAGVMAQQEAAALAEKAAIGRAQYTHVAMHTLRLDLILSDERARTRGKEKAAELLKEYGLPEDADWQKRPAFTRLPEANRSAVAAEIGELLLLLAEAHWRDVKLDPNADLRAAATESLRLNRLARTCFAAEAVPPFLVRQHKELAAVVGQAGDQLEPVVEPGKPATPRDHFLEATRLIAASRYELAIDPLQTVVAAEPDHAAAQFCLALCRHQLGQHARALERYEVARALIPNDPRPSYSRGLVFQLENRPEMAEPEFVRAIDLNPKFGDAYRNRASARYRLGRLKEAEGDLTIALEHGAPPLHVYLLRADIRSAQGNKAGAAEDLAASAAYPPKSELDYLARGWTRIKSDPKGALSDYETAARLNPRSIQALLNQTHLLADARGDLPAALVVADRLVEQVPEYVPGRAARAVVLARLGRRAEAHAEATRAKQSSDHATITYQVACVYAVTSTIAGDQAKADRDAAMKYLRKSYRDGYRNVSGLETDRDLDSLRNLAEFATFLQAAKELSR